MKVQSEIKFCMKKYSLSQVLHCEGVYTQWKENYNVISVTALEIGCRLTSSKAY